LSILLGVITARGRGFFESFIVKSALGTGYLVRLPMDGVAIDVVNLRRRSSEVELQEKNSTLSASLISSKLAQGQYRRIPAVFTKTSQICGKKFQTRANNAKHCSKECRLEAKRRRRSASRGSPKTIKKICDRCGKSYETKLTIQKFCSDECYRLASAERKRVKREKRREIVIKPNEDMFLDLCSICGAENVPVSECRTCGFLCCGECLNDSGLCRVCIKE
jgi:predicted nucleic acid-binding Zn ribbon protein